jgi:hypothetical protein
LGSFPLSAGDFHAAGQPKEMPEVSAKPGGGIIGFIHTPDFLLHFGGFPNQIRQTAHLPMIPVL